MCQQMNPHHAHRNPVLRQIHARPRLTTSTVIGLLAAFFLPHAVAGHITTRLLLAWNIGAWLYLILAGIMMVRSCHDKMRLRAKVQDEGRVVVLI
ncbi:MAG TPA: hypothetical protein VFW00_09220, partial [Rhodocyclaceae bacterium]|nr:hypothetical protein [Rhodocyclaceae bacterium]